MVKVGDVLRVRTGAPYSITSSGSLVEVIEVFDSEYVEVTLLDPANRRFDYHRGDCFSLFVKYLEPAFELQGPQLPPVYLKIRSMHARQQEKGILRY